MRPGGSRIFGRINGLDLEPRWNAYDSDGTRIVVFSGVRICIIATDRVRRDLSDRARRVRPGYAVPNVAVRSRNGARDGIRGRPSRGR